MRALLEAAMAEGVFSGAVLRVEDLAGEGALAEWVVGTVSSEPMGPPVRSETTFDLASLTKLYTAMAVLRLVARGDLQLDQRLRDLLEHRSGLPAWAPLFGRADVREAARQIAPGPRGEHLYSDIGFLQLLDLLPAEIDTLLMGEVLAPLGLLGTDFRAVGAGDEEALRRVWGGRVVATEWCPRRGFLVGEVSDGNTWAMGGVSGHAGLFASASDVAEFARGVWEAPETGFLPQELVDAIWADPVEPGTHVLGWDTLRPGVSSVGSQLSRRSRGHLGFSGTSLWIDPEREVAIVLLTNRIHPHRQDDRIRALRPPLHDAVADFVDTFR